jgi:signal transduction histidine kinase/integral membrane sensor domain MASE1
VDAEVTISAVVGRATAGDRWSPVVRRLAIGLAVALAYYLGAQIGDHLQLFPVTASIMWPPNAILTATLLLAAPRRWAFYLLAAFPAHLLALPETRPTPLGLLLFLTNCSEAVVGAATTRLLSDRPASFDTLRRISAFILGGAIIGPLVSSYLDAAVAAGLHGEPYWLVWRIRFFSNMLTELALVPSIIVPITRGPAWIRQASPRRRLEALLLAMAPAVAWITMQEAMKVSSVFHDFPVALLAFLAPSLAWAALRFGPGATAMVLLANTLLAVWSGGLRAGVFVGVPPGEQLFALQIFLAAQGMPLLCLAAAVQERRSVQEALGERLRFEELLSRLSGTFVNLPGHASDAAFEAGLRQLAEFLRVDRVALWQPQRDTGGFVVLYSWHRPDVPPGPRAVAASDFPWTTSALHRFRRVAFSRPEELPAEAARDADGFRSLGIQSGLVVPLIAGGHVLGSLALLTLTAERIWPEELVQRLHLVAEVFANAIAQGEADEALRASEAMNSAILATLHSGVAVLDQAGRIVAANDRWGQFTSDWAVFGVPLDTDADYLNACRDAAEAGVVAAAEAVAGIDSVLRGERLSFALEYSLGMESTSRWFGLSVLPLTGRHGGAVISQTDITERKRAEIDAQRSRQELAHFTRVSTMGELAASLAHELNQPLTGILANAQAARRFLDGVAPDLDEIRAILSDIIDDDRRAGDVIRRLREFLRKGPAEVAPLDLNLVVRDVVRLLGSDALIRDVTITVDLDQRQPTIKGDRVHLQQLLLNLLLNAMEATAEAGRESRVVTVRTRVLPDHTVDLTVEDTGPGIRPGAEKLLFEPFYTTKPSGMGMGLSIARSIVDAHGGRIHADSNVPRGATFHVLLPLAGATPS